MKKNEMIAGVRILGILIALSMMISLASAGVGIKWDQQSKLVEQGGRACLTYSVYNPWPRDSYVAIKISGDAETIANSEDSSSKLIPANTPSNDAIPVDFCFDVPYVYSDERDCWIGNLFCKQDCSSPQKIYNGEILVTETGANVAGGGSGGSSTSVSVSAPLSVRVQCVAYPRNLTLLYAVIAFICVVIIIYMIYRRNRMPAVARDKEKLKRLQEKIRKESKKK
jgi:hypothetical protein